MSGSKLPDEPTGQIPIVLPAAIGQSAFALKEIEYAVDF